MNEFPGLRVLLVEDDVLVSMLLEDMLVEFGCQIVGPADRVPQGEALAAEAAIDVALLDVNVAGSDVYPVAKCLAKRGIPFAFVTGYQIGFPRREYQDRPTVQKPVAKTELEQVIRTTLDRKE